MKKLLLLIPLIALLTACQSKKEICARWEAGQWEKEDYWDSYTKVQKSLGLDKNGDVEKYCWYYKH